jgi:perosamine synthetase
MIVEDASQALGAKYWKRRVGTLGRIGIFSVGGDMTKSISTAEGGVIITDDDELAEKCRALRNHGDRYQEKTYLCYNYRMSDLQALVGYYFFQSIEDEVKWQKERGKYILERIPPYLISLQNEREGVEPAYYILGFEVVGLEAQKVVEAFEKAGISRNRPRMNIVRGYRRLAYELPFYRKYARPCPRSEEKTRKSVWVDYHRRPRTYAEIDRMLKVSRRIR